MAAVGGLAAFGCASGPAPQELVDARSAYTRAQGGPANQLKPDKLHEAKVALDKAEQAYRDNPSAESTKDLAYVAQRKIQLSEVQAREAQTALERQQAEKDVNQGTRNQLSQANQQLAASGQQLAAAGQALVGTQEQLQNEKKARADADKRAKDAIDKLATAVAGSVKQEPRGTVITLSGSVLFASAKTALLPGAQTKLNAVAEALKNQEDKQILIEGHTDSQGTDASNQELSQGRAQVVKDYLVSQGVSSDKVQAKGLASARPVADNKSPEGRANNRRVEIVIQGTEQK